ncbi:uncharacterized protein I303_102774 [Kwoniella dejecticola CBS 10117]|uniref:CTD kinase subunit beta n=1 Tax=Kwoniella dejecticola CBS 10117 TaxID=1296121 RepID=A0A1A6A9N8_9TREE|nr:CTD kinase subunit beta [Kwoniella dejecticola CBS 10117]OBR86773.1 CTD kinase subunit beta [Kwoniella dejecticola CBS 10117]
MAASSSSKAHVKHFKPYFSPVEVEKLSAKQRGKLSVSREEKVRQQACGFIDAVGIRCGFPRKTIATAQTLYMRFHLFFPYKDFNYVEVALSTLYVSSKLHDTIKKPREIILASFPIRYPNLIRKGTIDVATAEANGLEHERKRVLACERLVLETMGFKFGVETGLRGVIKIGKKLGLDKALCQNAWKVAVDCHRTQAPLSFPPHITALGSIYTAALLLSETSKSPASGTLPSSDAGSTTHIIAMLGKSGSWETEYSASSSHIDEIAHYLIDLYTTILSTLPDNIPSAHTPSPVSPKEPNPAASQSTNPTTSSPTAFPLPLYWTSQTLTELKIQLRDRRPGAPAVNIGWVAAGSDLVSENEGDEAVEGMGKNEGTIRFLWDEEVLS